MPAKIGMNFVSSRSKGIPVQTISNSAKTFGLKQTGSQAGSGLMNFGRLQGQKTGCKSCGH